MIFKKSKAKSNIPVTRIFRRRFGMETWHWCTSCIGYPVDNFEEARAEAQPEGKFCAECRSIEMASANAVLTKTGGHKKPLRYYLF